MIVSVIVISISIKLKRNDRIGNQFYGTMLIFWSVVFVIALVPEILESLLNVIGLGNRAQFLFGISVIMILYLLYVQTTKGKHAAKLNGIVRELALSNFKKNAESSNEKTDLVIIITAKDESKTIGTVIDKINSLQIPSSYKILVVNDGSTDDTEQVATAKGALVITHFYNLGIGAAIKTGLVASKIFKPKILVNIDADGQHDPKYIPEMVSKIKDGKADLVYASRFAKESNYKTTPVRTVGNKFYTKLVNRIAKISISDVTSGYRAMRFDKLKSVFFVAETNFAIELAIRAGRSGMKVTEIPTLAESREFGTSQFHRIEKFFLYNVNAISQIFNAYSRNPELSA